MGLNNLSVQLAFVGDGEAALAAIREAVEIRRQLAQDNPNRFAPDLAVSLENLALRLSDAGNGAGALGAICEAVEICRRLAQDDATRFAPALEATLKILHLLEQN
jgi:hypothetical protein